MGILSYLTLGGCKKNPCYNEECYIVIMREAMNNNYSFIYKKRANQKKKTVFKNTDANSERRDKQYQLRHLGC